jgi:hypothetical protein
MACACGRVCACALGRFRMRARARSARKAAFGIARGARTAASSAPRAPRDSRSPIGCEAPAGRKRAYTSCARAPSVGEACSAPAAPGRARGAGRAVEASHKEGRGGHLEPMMFCKFLMCSG